MQVQSTRRPYPKNRAPRRPSIETTCRVCEKPITIAASMYDSGVRCCSKQCQAQGQRKQPERIWRFGERTEQGCLTWTRSRHKWGYGFIRVDEQAQLVHRIAWELTYGPIPDGLWVLHRCDNPPCFEPTHLFLGTQADNTADMDAKGRRRSRAVHGAEQGSALLTDDIVRQIRAQRFQGMTLKSIAAAHGIHVSTVSLVANRKSWRHVV